MQKQIGGYLLFFFSNIETRILQTKLVVLHLHGQQTIIVFFGSYQEDMKLLNEVSFIQNHSYSRNAKQKSIQSSMSMNDMLHVNILI